MTKDGTRPIPRSAAYKKQHRPAGTLHSANTLSYKNFLASRGYVIKHTLGSGSYSKVKLAVDLNNKDKLVAIKIVDTAKAPHDYQHKFMPRELELWPQLDHPHLVKLIESFKDEKRVYMVEQYAPGGDMLHYIQQQGVIDESVAREWILQVMDAICYMHESGMGHRDLKLENLLINTQWNLQICDFGFTKSLSENLSQTYCGSKSYAAPEILMGQPYDPMKADVWALGVILYIMVTGKMPFDESKSTKQLLEEMRQQNFRWFKYPDISDSCKRIIHTMFTWNFKHRPYLFDIMAHTWFNITLTGFGLEGLRESVSKAGAGQKPQSPSTSSGQ